MYCPLAIYTYMRAALRDNISHYFLPSQTFRCTICYRFPYPQHSHWIWCAVSRYWQVDFCQKAAHSAQKALTSAQIKIEDLKLQLEAATASNRAAAQDTEALRTEVAEKASTITRLRVEKQVSYMVHC